MQDNYIITQSPEDQSRKISILNAILVSLVAIGSFALSYRNLRLMAVENGITGPLSYIWPLLIDFALIVFSLSVVVAYARAESTWRQWSLVIVYTIATVAFNVWHSEPELTARIVSAIAPISLFFSFELLMNQIKNQMARQGLLLSISQLQQVLNSKQAELDALIETKQAELNEIVQAKQFEIDTLTQQAYKLRPEIEQPALSLERPRQETNYIQRVQYTSIEHARQIKDKQTTLSIEQRRESLIEILTVEGDIGASAFANRLNSSRGTVYSDLKALSEAGRIIKNGDGWEVAE